MFMTSMKKLTPILILFFFTACAHQGSPKKISFQKLKHQCEQQKNWGSCYQYAPLIRHTEPEKYQELLKLSCQNGIKESCPSEYTYLTQIQGMNTIPSQQRKPASAADSVGKILKITNQVTGHPLERAAHRNKPRFLGREEPFFWLMPSLNR